MRQLAVVLVNVPLELMYWPALLTTATWTSAHGGVVLGAAADEDLASVNAVPSVGEARVSLRARGEVTRVDPVAGRGPEVEVSCWPAVSKANAVTASRPWSAG